MLGVVAESTPPLVLEKVPHVARPDAPSEYVLDVITQVPTIGGEMKKPVG